MKKRVKKAKKKIFHMAFATFIFGFFSLILPYLAYISILIGIYSIAKINNTNNFKGKEYVYSGVIISLFSLLLYGLGVLQ
jgi:hypothetical protein